MDGKNGHRVGVLKPYEASRVETYPVYPQLLRDSPKLRSTGMPQRAPPRLNPSNAPFPSDRRAQRCSDRNEDNPQTNLDHKNIRPTDGDSLAHILGAISPLAPYEESVHRPCPGRRKSQYEYVNTGPKLALSFPDPPCSLLRRKPFPNQT